MKSNGIIYEREFRTILEGDNEKLKKMSWISEEMKNKIRKKPFMVVRAAGSHGFDLIIIRHDISLPIEIKSSREKTVNFSSSSNRSQLQAENYLKIISKTGVMPLYAFRLKNVSGDPWRIFTLDATYEGKYRLVSKIIPRLDISKRGVYSMKWENGLSLTSLLEYLF